MPANGEALDLLTAQSSRTLHRQHLLAHRTVWGDAKISGAPPPGPPPLLRSGPPPRPGPPWSAASGCPQHLARLPPAGHCDASHLHGMHIIWNEAVKLDALRGQPQLHASLRMPQEGPVTAAQEHVDPAGHCSTLHLHAMESAEATPVLGMARAAFPSTGSASVASMTCRRIALQCCTEPPCTPAACCCRLLC